MPHPPDERETGREELRGADDGAAWRRLAGRSGEVKMARQISHPNVCRVHDVGEVEGLTYLSMEYIDGEDLASLLRRIGRLASDKAIEIAQQVARGLAAAHKQGVLHQDLKPANLMIDGRGRAKITDFGLAGLRPDESGGTPAYMAPELFDGAAPSVASDLYALGLVLYELFTGRRPFQGKDFGALARQHKSAEPLAPSYVVDDPANRPGSATEVAVAGKAKTQRRRRAHVPTGL